jgi:hypothetical protein
MASKALLEAVVVTAELCGRVFSGPAARVFVADLSAYPEAQIIGALARCRRELKGLLTVADVVSRLDDGRPGVEEAWARMPQGEEQTVVWTAEAAQAFGVAAPLLRGGDAVAARMAFKETYTRLVAQARERAQPVEWLVSPGHDPNGRTGVILDSLRAGLIGEDMAKEYLPAPEIAENVRSRLPNQAPRRLPNA